MLSINLMSITLHSIHRYLRRIRKSLTMFQKLQRKWNVSAFDLVLILFTFAIGGSMTGWVARKLLAQLPIEAGAGWIICYILLVTLIWPVAVMLVSIPFGQFRFFKRY